MIEVWVNISGATAARQEMCVLTVLVSLHAGCCRQAHPVDLLTFSTLPSPRLRNVLSSYICHENFTNNQHFVYPDIVLKLNTHQMAHSEIFPV